MSLEISQIFQRKIEEPTGFFIQTQGFERRFIQQNFTKYFGEDVEWKSSVDWNTGKEGFEVRVRLQPHIREEILARMQRDAKWAFVGAITDRKESSNPVPLPVSPSQNGTNLSSRITDMQDPYSDLFPAPEFLVAADEMQAHGGRLARSAPSSPLAATTTARIVRPGGILSPQGAMFSDSLDFYDDPEEYEYPQGWNAAHFEIPALVLDRAPTLWPMQPLRPSRSAGAIA